MRSSESAFCPLTNQDFGELEKLGCRKFTPAIRKSLNAHLRRLHDAPINARRSSRKHVPLQRRLSHLVKNCERLLAQFQAERWEIYHCNALTEPFYLPIEQKIKDVLSLALHELKQSVPHAVANAEIHRKKSGPKRNLWIHKFLEGAADAYHNAGGCVSAAAQRDKGRNSPFMRFLQYLHERLPRERRMLSPAALAEWAHKFGIPGWKASRQG